MKKKEAIPNPSSLMESMREIGYSFETAIADVIDNSISAKAKSVHFRFNWNFGKPWVGIIDDGIGMTNEKLFEAMTIGSLNPLDPREPEDLGRFGLGLKTASLSQTRRFTVITKKRNQYNIAEWDIDSRDIKNKNKWMINLYDLNEIKNNLKNLVDSYLDNQSNGTIVFWDKIDRLDLGENPRNKEQKFDNLMSEVNDNLDLVFHRYISPVLGSRKVNIVCNGNKLKGFDPFFINKSEEMHYEEIIFNNAKIGVQPYVLPHHTKVTKDDWNYYSGKRGYLHEQGFYIYRNKRLIIYANWFRLIPKSELTKLLRVKIDIPNTLDHLWKIDIKKSNAVPPIEIKEKLKNIIGKIEFAGKRVYKQRGKKLIENIKEPSWLRVAKEDKIFYKVNTDHSIIKNILKGVSEERREHLLSYLKILETTFPRDAYFNDISSEPEKTSNIQVDASLIEDAIIFMAGGAEKKPSKSELDQLLLIDPFAKDPELTKEIYKKLKYEQ